MKYKLNTIVVFNKYTSVAFPKIDSVWMIHEGHEAFLTSGLDGTHSEGSFHYQGRAWDFRQPVNIQTVCIALEKTLGPEYQVLPEGDHIHIEYDPKT